jgi:signal transduction histidine kinase
VPLRHATSSAHHLRDLINDLLALSAIEAGTLQLERQKFNLRESLDGLIEKTAQRAGDKHLSFDTRLDDALPKHILGDRHRIEQVLHHLCDNALQFTKVGGFSLAVDVISQDSETARLRLTRGWGSSPSSSPASSHSSPLR